MYLFMLSLTSFFFFFKIYFFKTFFQGVSNGPDCLQRVSADDKSQGLDINVDTLPFRDVLDAENMKVTKNAN